MMKLKNIGGKYNGFDGEVEIILNTGDIFDVSDTKAEQLLSDFPKSFEKVLEIDDTIPIEVEEPKKRKYNKK